MNLRNNVQLIGNLGNDPAIINTSNEKKLVRFSIATTDYIQDNGELKTKTYWHNIIAWGGMADTIVKKCTKGTEVIINGKLVNRSYEDKTGTKKYITEVVVNEIICRTGIITTTL